MKTVFRKNFTKDLKTYRKDKNLLTRIRQTILEIETAENIGAVRSLKKLQTEVAYYRIRVGDYRIGLIIEGDTVAFIRLLHRKDIYRYFP